MLRTAGELGRYRIEAKDGDAGRVRDVYFDARAWVVRYLVVDTAGWIGRNDVLLRPDAIEALEPRELRMRASVDRVQIERAPTPDAERPVTRAYETRLHDHYRWTPYWSMSMFPQPGVGVYQTAAGTVPAPDEELAAQLAADTAGSGNDALQSFEDVRGFVVQTADPDGRGATLDDLVIDPSDWRVTHLVVGDRAVPVAGVARVDAEAKAVILSLTTAALRGEREVADVIRGASSAPAGGFTSSQHRASSSPSSL